MTNILEEDISGIVKYQASKFYFKLKETIAFEDLHDAGRDGVRYALKYFDESRGKSWSGFVTLCVRQRIMTFIKRKGDKLIHNEPFIAHKNTMTGLSAEEYGQANNQYSRMLPKDDNEQYMTTENQEYLEWLMFNSDLNERELDMIILRMAPMLLRELAEYFNITKERCRQILDSAQDKMVRRHKLEQYKVMYE